MTMTVAGTIWMNVCSGAEGEGRATTRASPNGRSARVYDSLRTTF
jgi:hypothetical protein